MCLVVVMIQINRCTEIGCRGTNFGQGESWHTLRESNAAIPSKFYTHRVFRRPFQLDSSRISATRKSRKDKMTDQDCRKGKGGWNN